MDGATIQARVSRGYGKAASVVGTPHAHWRPTQGSPPLSPASRLPADIKVAHDTGATFSYSQPAGYGNAIRYALVNTASVHSGDYLADEAAGIDGSTMFVASVQFLLAAMVVRCNASVRIHRQRSQPLGLGGYGGITDGTAVDVLSDAWPCSLLQTGGGGQSANLPASPRPGGWRLLLPASVPAAIDEGDIAVSEGGRRFMVEAAELSHLGWRIHASELRA